MFQSTCPHGARHDVIIVTFKESRVSIHVPTRGTTPAAGWIKELTWVSIHVPTRGTTAKAKIELQEVEVSIHVPTRGTTRKRITDVLLHIGFNPRAHTGHDDAKD